MACISAFLRTMVEFGYIAHQSAFLDIGEQCLLGATRQELDCVFERLGCRISPDDYNREVNELVMRSNLFGHDTIPTLYLGDVLKHTTVEYVALDIVTTRYAERFDLNRHRLAYQHCNRFDTVFNMGTSEHVLNQLNTFRLMHDACRPGGYMITQVPCTGYINHGYFNYNALLFEDLAKANGYIIEELWFSGPGQHVNLAAENPKWFAHRNRLPFIDNSAALISDAHGHVAINVIFRKVDAHPFLAPNEVRTAAHSTIESAPFTSSYIDPSSELIPQQIEQLKKQMSKISEAHRQEFGHVQNGLKSIERLSSRPWWWRAAAKAKRSIFG